jgi:hypothetical protein
MRKNKKTQGKTKTRGKTKTAPKSLVKRRNPPGAQPLSFALPAKDDMTVQTGAAPRHLVHDSINLVLAECDKVDAALIGITQDHKMPPLAIMQVATTDSGGAAKTGWAVVSGDPQRPLTESDAKRIVAAMRRLRTSAPMWIAAE